MNQDNRNPRAGVVFPNKPAITFHAYLRHRWRRYTRRFPRAIPFVQFFVVCLVTWFSVLALSLTIVVGVAAMAGALRG